MDAQFEVLERDISFDHVQGYPALSVVVPALNEEAAIGTVLGQLTHVLNAADISHEMIVVDDGSQDKTASIAEGFTEVKLLQHGGNRGYGAALKTGIRHASHELICIVDADGSYPVESIPLLFHTIAGGDLDMVVGARIGVDARIPLMRRPAKWVIRKMAQLVVNESIPDLNSGLRLFRRSSVLRFFNLLPDGFSFTTTITLGMLTNGYLVAYETINYLPRLGRSKIRPIRDTLNFVQLVLRIALYFAPLKVFLPISGFLLFVAALWAFFSAQFLGRLADASAAVIVMAAVQVAVVGMLAELIDRRLPNFHKSEENERQALRPPDQVSDREPI